MNTSTTHKIPLKALIASTFSVVKKGFPKYLRYVRIQNGYVASTDNHRAILFDIDGLDKELDISIQTNIIKELHAGLGKKEKDGDVEISVTTNQDSEQIITMSYKNHYVEFINEEIGKFPNIKRVIPSDDKIVDCMPSFNVSYVMDMQKVANLISRGDMQILPTGKNSPMIFKFPASDLNVVGVVMPKRS
ncbi:MAG: hypothetical protein Q4B81_04160 [Moraxella sp.]|nr:hypothetical protein [Moraxella sp.]